MHTHTHIHTHTHTHTLSIGANKSSNLVCPFSYKKTFSFSLPPALLAFTLSLALSRVLSLSIYLSLYLALSLFLARSLARSRSRSLSRARALSLSASLSLSLSLSLSHTQLHLRTISLLIFSTRYSLLRFIYIFKIYFFLFLVVADVGPFCVFFLSFVCLYCRSRTARGRSSCFFF